jgi:hypothetical protein
MERDGKPGFWRRLGESLLALGVVALLGGLVCAFVVAGLFGLHAVLDRNRDPHADRAAAPLARAELASEARPEAFAPPSPAVAVSVAPPPPSPVPPPLPPKDPTRVDAEGFIRYWLVLGPIPSDKDMAGGAEVQKEQLPNEGALRPRAEERASVKGKELGWKRWRTTDFFLDFRKFVEGQRADDAVAYAVAYVVSAEELKDVKLFIGSNDQARVYLNGQRVLQVEKSRTLQKDQDVAAGLTLRKGQNVVVFKVVNEKNLWQGCLRFADRNGTPLTQIHVTSTPE